MSARPKSRPLMPTRRNMAVLGVTVAILLGAALVMQRGRRPRWADGTSATGPRSDDQYRVLTRELAALRAREEEASEVVWQKELLAQRHGAVFEELWNALNAATNKLALAASVAVPAIIPPVLKKPRDLGHGIRQHDPGGAGALWGSSDWRQFLDARRADGWELAQVEFRHNRFEVDELNRPKKSRCAFTAHLENVRLGERAILEGDLLVDWEPVTPTGLPGVRRIDASGLDVKIRRGDPAFQLVFEAQVEPLGKTRIIDPRIAYDLDGDGISEFILAGRNLLFRRAPDGHFESEPLCRHPPQWISAAVIADFDGDGSADLLCAAADGLIFFPGSRRGTFDEPGRAAWMAGATLDFPQVLTCGDVDGDGDLDVWLGQYKAPYERGQVPTPYFDANDGYPSYLLLNDGHGVFTDATESARLGKKRRRRCYSASLVDVDGDGALDLLVVSDFAGVDLYTNDGHGHFVEVTSQWIGESHGFGMAHAWADFNRDGRPDLLMIGMNSPTADRLENLGMTRPGFENYDAMRSRMAHGNRLYLGRDDGPGLVPAESSEAIVRTGWSWGCSAFDFDNDGFPDVYIANGHMSGHSVSDLEPEFWLHDIYVGNSRDSAVTYAYLADKFNQAREQGRSFGGYEKNRLLWK